VLIAGGRIRSWLASGGALSIRDENDLHITTIRYDTTSARERPLGDCMTLNVARRSTRVLVVKGSKVARPEDARISLRLAGTSRSGACNLARCGIAGLMVKCLVLAAVYRRDGTLGEEDYIELWALLIGEALRNTGRDAICWIVEGQGIGVSGVDQGVRRYSASTT